MKAADCVMNTNPDSAYKILAIHENESYKCPQSQQMRYQLLKAKAQNKISKPFNTAKTMTDVAMYYNSHGNRYNKMLAYYLLGCAYRDLGDSPKALETYWQAVNLADTASKDCDFRELSHIYGQMAVIYHSHRMQDQELKSLTLGETYALKAGDTINAIKIYEQKKGAYYFKNMYDSVIYVEKKARDLYTKYGYNERAASSTTYSINIYIKRHEYKKAKVLMDMFESQSCWFKKDGDVQKGGETYYYAKGKYYVGINKLDSALYYFNKLQRLKSNLNDAEGAYEGLVSVYEKLGVADSLIKYSKLYCMANDSLSLASSSKELSQMEALYNYSIEKGKLYKKDIEIRRIWTCLLLCITASVLILGFIFYKIKMNKEKEKEKMEALKTKCATSIAQFEQAKYNMQLLSNRHEKYKSSTETELKKKDALYENIKQQYTDAQKKLEQLKILIDTQWRNNNEEILELRKIISIYQSKKTTSKKWAIEYAILDSNIKKHFDSLLYKGQAATESEKEDLILFMRENVTAFMEYVTSSQYKLSVQEILICIMSVLDFTPKSVATLLALSSQRVTNIRSKVNMALFKEKGTATFDKNIRELIHRTENQ